MSSNTDTPVIKPSSARSLKLCPRRAWLEIKSDIKAEPIDAFAQLLIERGLKHEATILNQLSQQFTVHQSTSVENTQKLMSNGVQVIYQAHLIDEQNHLIGNPDFLIRHSSGQYQPADAKLSNNEEKNEIQIQLGFYRRILANGLSAIVYLGDGSEVLIGDEANPITDKYITAMRALLTSDSEPDVKYGHSKCSACPFNWHCKPNFEAKQDLSLLYGIDGRAVNGLENAGIRTIAGLAASQPQNIPDVPYLKGYIKRNRAVLQAKSYLSGDVFQLSPISLPEGTWVHFDIEDNPLTANGEKHVYLWGFLVPDYAKENFEYVWTDTSADDLQGWLQFLKKINEYRLKYPSLVLAHYSHHEVTTIKAYAKRYDMVDDETIMYLLDENGPLFDLRKPIGDSLVLPLQGYGLKDICKHEGLVNFQWEDDDAGSQWSVVCFNHYLAETSPETKMNLKGKILTYNRDDVMATRQLEEWLRIKFMTAVVK